MKKLLIASFALLFCLRDVGKKETPAASTTASDPIQSNLPVMDNADEAAHEKRQTTTNGTESR